MLAISVPAFLLADKWGRRTSAITGGIGLSGCMFLIGSLYAAGAVHPYGAARWVVIVSVFLFGLIYCATWGIVGKIYASEIQPTHVRAAANCVAQGLGFVSMNVPQCSSLTSTDTCLQFTNWLVAMLTPILLDKSAFGAYFLFGGLAVFTVIVLGACMPETRGRSLEDIQQAFHQPALSNLGSRLRRRTARKVTEDTHLSETGNGSSGVELRSSALDASATHPGQAVVGSLARGLRVES